MLWRRHFTEAQVAREAEGRQKAHEAHRPRRHSSGGISCGPEGWGRQQLTVCAGHATSEKTIAAIDVSGRADTPKIEKSAHETKGLDLKMCKSQSCKKIKDS